MSESSEFRIIYSSNQKDGNSNSLKEIVQVPSEVVISCAPLNSEKDGDYHEKENAAFFRSIQPFLIFGRIIGLLPFSGIFVKSGTSLEYRRKSLATAFSFGIMCLMVFNAGIDFIHFARAPKRNAVQIAESIRSTMYFAWSCQIYIYFLLRGKDFLKIFEVWSSTLFTYPKRDKTLRRDASLITAVVMLSAIFENVVLNVDYFNSLDKFDRGRLKNMTFLEVYYWRAHPQWATTLGHNWFLALLAFFQHKCALYAWNYMDVAIAVFARAMYFRFKSLCEEAEKALLEREDISMHKLRRGICSDQHGWLKVVHDHQNLCRILQTLENFFSPIVFGSFAVNLFYISLQLLDGLTSEITKRTLLHSIYAPWSFLHLVMRTYIVSICCARINVYAHKVQNIIMECPMEQYTTEIYRIDKKVTTGPNIGLTGMGCFTVTKPFILSIVSVVFTFEIVLLQSSPNTNN